MLMILAIRGAYRDAQTLHRDISMANIMLDSNMNGFLNDWDRAIRLSASEADRATRTVRLLLIYFPLLIQSFFRAHGGFSL